jgi:hypothetical protein
VKYECGLLSNAIEGQIVFSLMIDGQRSPLEVGTWSVFAQAKTGPKN